MIEPTLVYSSFFVAKKTPCVLSRSGPACTSAAAPREGTPERRRAAGATGPPDGRRGKGIQPTDMGKVIHIFQRGSYTTNIHQPVFFQHVNIRTYTWVNSNDLTVTEPWESWYL